MKTRWHKVTRDFWQERTRTFLVVIAIALGIAAFDAVLSAYAILTRELDRGYLATNPASAILITDSIDDELVAAVLKSGEVSDAEPRRVVSGQIKTGPALWRNVVLFVVKDYGNIRVSRLEPEKGSWPPALGEILIERDAFQVAQANIGDAITIKTANGIEQPLIISGRVHDVGQAQARMENIVYGYITLDTLARLGEEPSLDQLRILVRDNRLNEKHIQEVTTNVKNLLEARGHQVSRVEIPKPGKHPHSDIMGVLLLSMSSFGIFVLILSGILVVNLLTGMMATEVRQIGVMKAIGATRWQITQIYFGQALLLGLAAILVALPLGYLAARALCDYMSIFLNFDINSYDVPFWVYLLVGVIGIVAPLLAASYPVLRGSSISVHAALSDPGITGSKFGNSYFDRLLSNIGGTLRPLLLSFRNCFRRRMRFALTLLTLSVSGLFFMVALNVRASMINTLDRMFSLRNYDLSLALASPAEMEKVQRAVEKTPGVSAVEGWFFSEGTLLNQPAATLPDPHASGPHAADIGADRFTVVALPTETQLLKFDVIEGRKLSAQDSTAIVINNALATRHPEMKVGTTINLLIGPAETSWQIVGITREAFSPATAYISQSFIQQRHPGLVNSVRIQAKNSNADEMDELKATLDKNLQAEGVRARSSSSKADSRFGFDQHMVMIYVFLIVMSSIIGGVGGLGLMTTMSLNILERRREMGVLRAIGATPGRIWFIVIAEALVIGVLSWLIATILAWPVSAFVGNLVVGMLFRSGLDFKFEVVGVVTWLAVAVVLSVISSFLPAWRASRLTVRESLAYE